MTFELKIKSNYKSIRNVCLRERKRRVENLQVGMLIWYFSNNWSLTTPVPAIVNERNWARHADMMNAFLLIWIIIFKPIY